MSEPLSPSAQRVQAALAAKGFAFTVQELPSSTRTAAGTPHALFRLAPAELAELCAGQVARIC